MLKKYSLKALQTAINQALRLDEQMPEKLSAYDGKIIEMNIEPLSVRFFIRFEQKEIQLLDQVDQKPDTIIHSSPIGLIRLSFLPASKARSIFNDKIRISGDLELGQNIKKLFDSMDIDWEGHLAHFTGDVVAHQIGSLFRKGRDFSRQFQHSMQQNISEYLQEEIRLCPSKAELEDFYNDVDHLVLATERLEAQLQLLMAKNENN